MGSMIITKNSFGLMFLAVYSCHVSRIKEDELAFLFCF